MSKDVKISILTPTYNRAELLENLYNSILKNIKFGLDIEWLIMDDGSTDATKEIVQNFQDQLFKNDINKSDENVLEIKYFYQKNQGKMVAINKLVEESRGDYIIDCDSDDYFTDNAFEIIKKAIEENKEEKDIYGLCFLKFDQNENNMGNNFKNKKTTMFDLYFKEGETGEKAILFQSEIRKKYKHELEHGERFITEARMYHKMDEKYKMICINKPIMICEYQDKGYTKNIVKQFKENPFGYYKYFEEILQKDFRGVTFNKRLYAIKHYILFSYLTKSKKNLSKIRNFENKILFLILYLPGIVKTKKKFV